MLSVNKVYTEKDKYLTFLPAVPVDARLLDEEDDDTVRVDAPDGKLPAAAPDVEKNFNAERKVNLEVVPLT